MCIIRYFIILFVLCFFGNTCQAFCSGDTLRYQFYFPVGSSFLDLSYQNNGLRLDSLLSGIRSRQEHSMLRYLRLYSGSSPDGSSVGNKRLSDRRLASLRSAIQNRLAIPDSAFVLHYEGEGWEALSSLVEGSEMLYREEALRILRDTPVWATRNGAVVDPRKQQLTALRGGYVWRYMKEHFFPKLRYTSVVACDFEPFVTEKAVEPQDTLILRDTIAHTVFVRDTVERAVMIHDTVQVVVPMANTSNPFYMGVKTNLLYDALLVPNVGVEFYLNKGWSVSGNWMYAWWKNDRRHCYWRVYGGEIGLRKYLDSHVADKPLTGHHVGLYGQILTYDFEFGGKGYMGGRPGGSLWEKFNYGFGLEYGYSLAIARRLNLDFSLGVGYLGGTYYKYAPMDGYYVWEATKNRRWFGPTKAEVSLVWLLELGNYNNKKGGRR